MRVFSLPGELLLPDGIGPEFFSMDMLVYLGDPLVLPAVLGALEGAAEGHLAWHGCHPG